MVINGKAQKIFVIFKLSEVFWIKFPDASEKSWGGKDTHGAATAVPATRIARMRSDTVAAKYFPYVPFTIINDSPPLMDNAVCFYRGIGPVNFNFIVAAASFGFSTTFPGNDQDFGAFFGRIQSGIEMILNGGF